MPLLRRVFDEFLRSRWLLCWPGKLSRLRARFLTKLVSFVVELEVLLVGLVPRKPEELDAIYTCLFSYSLAA